MTRQPEPGAICYVVQEPRHKDRKTGVVKVPNMTPLLDWGSVELLLEEDEASMLNTAAMIRKLKRKLANYGDKDFIVASGAPQAIGVACTVAAVANGGRYTILVWDRQETRYWPVHVDIKRDT